MLVAISYDSPAILKDFAERHKIEYLLLSDSDSKIITRFGVLNNEATGMTKGMALPGYFFIDTNGKIREKYFEAKYTDRFTANNVLTKMFPELTEGVGQKVEAPHISLILRQSDHTVVPGSRLNLAASIELPSDVHVYAPGVTGYRPIQLEISPSPEILLNTPVYPAAKTLYLEAIKEKVPVFEGKFQIAFDLRIAATSEVIRSLGENGRTITVNGQLNYQACDKTKCFVPTSVPVSWRLEILPLDRQRSPEAIRHR